MPGVSSKFYRQLPVNITVSVLIWEQEQWYTCQDGQRLKMGFLLTACCSGGFRSHWR